MSEAKLIQLYSDKEIKGYPIVHRDGVINPDGSKTIETIEKKNNV